MKFEEFIENPKVAKQFTKMVLKIAFWTAVIIYGLVNLEKIYFFIQNVISMAAPFFLGMAIAYVVNVLLKFYEERAFGFLNRKNNKIWNKCRRGVCILLSFLSFLLVLGGIILFVVPELGKSLKILADNAPHYFNRLSTELFKYLEQWNITQSQINDLKVDWSTLLSKATQITTDFMGSLFSVTISVASGIFTMAMSFIFCMYMLFGKEKLTKNLKRLVYAYLPAKAAQKTIDVAILSNKIFSNFVRGQLTESCIWFLLCYLMMTLLQLPYALLISSIVALCSLIPIIGPYISMFTAGFILLLVNFWYCVTYIVAFLILQQIEGNLIYPKVVGTSVGLPGIWVLLAIILCGNMFGIVGILLGIPTFSVVYTLLKNSTKRRLQEREITLEQVLHNDPDFKPPA